MNLHLDRADKLSCKDVCGALNTLREAFANI